MSVSDEAFPAKDATPEPELVTDETSSDDGEVVEAELVGEGEVGGEVGMVESVVEEEVDPMVKVEHERDEYLLAL